MENQHRKIKGYRELTQEELDLMNEIKAKTAELGELIEAVNTFNETLPVGTELNDCYRWSAIARTDFQTGAMALTRAVAKPNFF